MNDGPSYIGHKIENSLYTSGSQVASIRNNNQEMLKSLVRDCVLRKNLKAKEQQ